LFFTKKIIQTHDNPYSYFLFKKSSTPKEGPRSRRNEGKNGQKQTKISEKRGNWREKDGFSSLPLEHWIDP
jgi:hypothetical protein